MPAFAQTYEIAAPIMPGAEHNDLLGRNGSMPSGRSRSPDARCRSKKNAWIMFLETCPVTRSTK